MKLKTGNFRISGGRNDKADAAISFPSEALNERRGRKMLENGGANEESTVWVLLSGGIDSTACVAFYREMGFPVYGVFIDYGHVAARHEALAAQAVASYYRVPLLELKWSGLREKHHGLILGRNAFLLFGTLMELPEEARILAIGIHSGTDYFDCTASFIRRIQSMFDSCTGGKVQVGTPFLTWKKSDIWAFCRRQGVPLELTYSCECGLDQPCGKCISCSDLEVLYACS